MELEAFNIQFDYIKGSSNILADTLSCLIVIDPNTPLTPEGRGHEFGYAIFEEFSEIKTNTYEVNEVIIGTKKEIKNDRSTGCPTVHREPNCPPVIEKATTRCQHRNSKTQAATQ